uniref:Uncharacterized protein n=1 Tax=Pygocentrus nattereri TaxID=42514 RepID=A0A3B4C9C1_PYGNA
MAPLAVVHLLAAGLHLDAARAHVHEQVQKALQQFHGKEVHPGPALSGPLHSSMAVQQQTTGLRGAEIKGDRASLFGIPARKSDIGSRCVKADWVQSSHIFTAEGQIAMQGDLGIMQLSQMGEL